MSVSWLLSWVFLVPAFIEFLPGGEHPDRGLTFILLALGFRILYRLEEKR